MKSICLDMTITLTTYGLFTKRRYSMQYSLISDIHCCDVQSTHAKWSNDP